MVRDAVGINRDVECIPLAEDAVTTVYARLIVVRNAIPLNKIKETP